jgi:hypothetical protein
MKKIIIILIIILVIGCSSILGSIVAYMTYSSTPPLNEQDPIVERQKSEQEQEQELIPISDPTSISYPDPDPDTITRTILGGWSKVPGISWIEKVYFKKSTFSDAINDNNAYTISKSDGSVLKQIYLPANKNWLNPVWSEPNIYRSDLSNGQLKSDNYVWYLIPRSNNENYIITTKYSYDSDLPAILQQLDNGKLSTYGVMQSSMDPNKLNGDYQFRITPKL